MGKKGLIPDVLNPDQLVQLFNAVDRPKVGLAMAVGFFCGLRINEVCNLQIGDIDMNSKRLKVRDSKNTKREKQGYGKDRYVPIPEQLLSPLQKWIDLMQGGKWLFPSHKSPDKPLRKKSLGEQFRIVLTKAGLLIPDRNLEFRQRINGKWQKRTITRYKYRFHTLRHSYATYLRGKGVEIDVIKELLGHERYDTTLIYSKISDVQRREAVKNAFSSQMRHQVITQQEVKRLTYPQQSQNPLDVLKMQVVMNEISEEEYKKKLALLTGHPPIQIEQSEQS